MDKALEWVKRDFCRIKGIPLSRELEIIHHGRTAQNDFEFTVSGPGFPMVGFTLPKIDLKLYSEWPALALEREYKDKPSRLTKEIICRWFNNKTALGMIPEDIANFLVRTDRVTVIGSVNSMRFKHTFYMRFQ